jgi:hypothetical protein
MDNLVRRHVAFCFGCTQRKHLQQARAQRSRTTHEQPVVLHHIFGRHPLDFNDHFKSKFDVAFAGYNCGKCRNSFKIDSENPTIFNLRSAAVTGGSKCSNPRVDGRYSFGLVRGHPLPARMALDYYSVYLAATTSQPPTLLCRRLWCSRV